MPCWSWDWQLCWAEISHLEDSKVAGNSGLCTAGLQLCVLCGSITCLHGHCCSLLRQTPLPPGSLLHLPTGKHFAFFWQLLISPSIRHFNTLALLRCFDTKIQKNCLCLCCTRITKELLNEYHLNYRISTTFLQRHSHFHIYIYICMPLQEFWDKKNKVFPFCQHNRRDRYYLFLLWVLFPAALYWV